MHKKLIETVGYVDSASVWSIPAALSETNPHNWPNWTLRAAVCTTGLLARTLSFFVMPGPNEWQGPSELYQNLISCLPAGVVLPTRKEDAAASKAVKEWVRSDLALIRKILDKTMGHDSYGPWMTWTLQMAWADHAQTYNGLFGTRYLREMAAVLGYTSKDIQAVRRISQDVAAVRKWAEQRPPDKDYKIAEQAYFLESILRGKYHAEVAALRKSHLLYHPLRDAIHGKGKRTGFFGLTNAEERFVSLLLSAPLAERSLANRISMWAENMSLVRTQMPRLDQMETDDLAIDAAVRAANLVSIRIDSKLSKAAFDILGMLICSLGPMFLRKWLLPNTPAQPLEGYMVQEEVRRSLGKPLGEAISDIIPPTRHQRLRVLARRLPGGLSTSGPDIGVDRPSANEAEPE
jgi:hypothetical protein